ncbi:hypothetical protein CLU79DRAFT_756758 [Phycomyces nitens]|nr:hypothetical protein CLU79DRAFT_756758 [Phycomyces nitens]
MSTSSLFSPLKVGHSSLNHRLVLCPLTRFRADNDHVPTPLMAEYYGQRASKGGLMISEATYITPVDGLLPNTPGIYTKAQVEGWKEISKSVHAKGATMFLQLWHTGRAASSQLNPNNEQPVGPSAISIQGKGLTGAPYEIPHALEVQEIPYIIETFVQAAKNAIEAGFDGVELHAANGYLIDQFINTSSNKRTDQYGGSIENRARFATELVSAVAEAIGEERTAIRFSPWSGFQDMKDDTPYETWGYLVSQFQEKHPRLGYIHFIEPRDDFLGRLDQPERAQIAETETVEPFQNIWKGPFLVSGGYTSNPKRAFETADKHNNTLVGIGRAFISNPDLPLRLKNDWPLSPYDRSTFYTNDAVGYTDYGFYE